MTDTGPFPSEWFYNSIPSQTQMQPWFPLPQNMINKGEEWIPEVQLKATVRLNHSDLLKISLVNVVFLSNSDMILNKCVILNDQALV